MDFFELYVEAKIMDDDKVKERFSVSKNQVLKVLKAMVIEELRDEDDTAVPEGPKRKRRTKAEMMEEKNDSDNS